MHDTGTQHDAVALLSAVERVLTQVARALATDLPPTGRHGPPDPPSDAPDRALERVAAAFGLGDFEVDVLALAAAVEVDPRAAPLYASAAGDARVTAPTFGLALATLSGAAWSALAPTAPLRRHRLVDLGAGPLTAAPLQIDERVLHALLGVDTLDARLAPRVTPLEAASPPPPSLRAAVRAVVAAWRADLPVQIVATDPEDRRAVAAAAAEEDGRDTWLVAAADLPAAVEERDAFARLWRREAVLAGRGLVVEVDDVDHPDAERAARWVARHLPAPVAVLARSAVAGGPAVLVEVDVPDAADQRALWAAALPRVRSADPDDLVERHDLGWTAIERAGRLAAAAGDAAGDAGATAVRDAVRAVTRPGLDGLAQRLATRAAWDDLVVPDAVRDALDDLVRHVRRRRRVREWGFDDTRGRGVAALFAGPSGSGKTLAAEVVAGALELDLYRVDLSAVVSKYIGETEKQLRRVLDAVEGGTAVVLFDEADALFGKRTELRDSHDRYANQEVAYLLQRLETFRGVALLTTNLRGGIDDAFLRRFRFVVTFPFPDAAQREGIWRAVMPAGAPTDGLDPARLARLGLPGGSIRNVVVGAAVAAADDGGVITPAHVRAAVEREYTKLGRTLTSADAAALGARGAGR